jgi:N-acyl-D-amino-acid deacylase
MRIARYWKTACHVRALLLVIAPLVAAGADYDVLIRNARVIDGSGNAWFRADVAVKNGRIAAIWPAGQFDGKPRHRRT